jgi:hypothetical protein
MGLEEGRSRCWVAFGLVLLSLTEHLSSGRGRELGAGTWEVWGCASSCLVPCFVLNKGGEFARTGATTGFAFF